LVNVTLYIQSTVYISYPNTYQGMISDYTSMRLYSLLNVLTYEVNVTAVYGYFFRLKKRYVWKPTSQLKSSFLVNNNRSFTFNVYKYRVHYDMHFVWMVSRIVMYMIPLSLYNYIIAL